jgi:hypothetical protein
MSRRWLASAPKLRSPRGEQPTSSVTSARGSSGCAATARVARARTSREGLVLARFAHLLAGDVDIMQSLAGIPGDVA